MDIMRYDGTRFVMEGEIDREFRGQWVLVSLTDLDNSWDGGYLIATVTSRDTLFSQTLAIDEFNANAKIYYGYRERGGNLYVELLG
jgi:hypothetical protein